MTFFLRLSRALLVVALSSLAALISSCAAPSAFALEAGDIVPADVRLTETNSLKIEESALTGESVACEKEANLVLDEKTVLNDRKNMAYFVL